MGSDSYNVFYVYKPVFYLLLWQTRLGNPEVRKIVEQCVQEQFTEYLELHPDALDLILTKSLNALKVFW